MVEAAVIVEQVQAHYEAQYYQFIEAQSKNCEQCSHEVKLQIDSGSFFSNLYCTDFLNNDDGPKLVEFAPEYKIDFQETTQELSSATLVLRSLQWDRVAIETDIDQISDAAISGWFEHWFDPNDKRTCDKQVLGNIIHSVLVDTGAMNVDFGSAEPQAFWDLIIALESAGASIIEVSSD